MKTKKTFHKKHIMNKLCLRKLKKNQKVKKKNMYICWNNIRSLTIWDKVFKSGLSKLCERQYLKYLKGYGLRKQSHMRYSLATWETKVKWLCYRYNQTKVHALERIAEKWIQGQISSGEKRVKFVANYAQKTAEESKPTK